MKTKVKGLISVATVSALLMATACTNPGAPGTANPGEPSQNECSPVVSVDADPVTIARAFNEYRVRCHPDEAQLLREVAKLR